MKKVNVTMEFDRNAERLGAIHTCGFKSVKNNAIFASINNIRKKTIYE